MEKMKNWILPAILVISGLLELGLDLVPGLIKEMGAPPYYATFVRLLALFLTVLIAKLQPPSLKASRASKRAKN